MIQPSAPFSGNVPPDSFANLLSLESIVVIVV